MHGFEPCLPVDTGQDPPYVGDRAVDAF